MIYFTADLHYNHINLCKGTSRWPNLSATRPFDTLDEMNSYITKRINMYVDTDDVLYILGDFALGDRSLIPTFRSKIACNTIHLIIGNHDYINKYLKYYACFDSIQYYQEIRYNKILFTICHYPLGSWNEIGKGSINLHGHCHHKYIRSLPRQFDVGIDKYYMPWSIEFLYNYMKRKPIEYVDAHTEETNYG